MAIVFDEVEGTVAAPESAESAALSAAKRSSTEEQDRLELQRALARIERLKARLIAD